MTATERAQQFLDKLDTHPPMLDSDHPTRLLFDVLAELRQRQTECDELQSEVGILEDSAEDVDAIKDERDELKLDVDELEKTAKRVSGLLGVASLDDAEEAIEALKAGK